MPEHEVNNATPAAILIHLDKDAGSSNYNAKYAIENGESPFAFKSSSSLEIEIRVWCIVTRVPGTFPLFPCAILV